MIIFRGNVSQLQLCLLIIFISFHVDLLAIFLHFLRRFVLPAFFIFRLIYDPSADDADFLQSIYHPINRRNTDFFIYFRDIVENLLAAVAVIF